MKQGNQVDFMWLQNFAIEASTANKENMLETVKRLLKAIEVQCKGIEIEMAGAETPYMEELICEMSYDALCEYYEQLELAITYLESGGNPLLVEQFIKDNQF